MSAVRPATSPLRPAVLLPGVALAAALALVVLRWAGDRGFTTDPVGALALAGGATAVAVWSTPGFPRWPWPS